MNIADATKALIDGKCDAIQSDWCGKSIYILAQGGIQLAHARDGKPIRCFHVRDLLADFILLKYVPEIDCNKCSCCHHMPKRIADRPLPYKPMEEHQNDHPQT